MGTPATGNVRWFNGVASARVRFADKRESFAMPECSADEATARARANVVAEVAQRLREARVEADQARKVLAVIAACPPRSLSTNLHAAQELMGGDSRPLGSAPKVPTFKEIGDDWVSGKLAKRYPDQIKVKRSADADRSRLQMHVYGALGALPIDRITLDHCEEAMRRLPAKLAVATRRNIGQLITRIMAMAVYPLRLIARSPIPAGFLASTGTRKALACLYPDEDARLLACTAVPLEYRLLWGFLAREGMREGEALQLTWGDLDLERGAIRLDRNKTDDPRAWALNPSVAAVLRAYREHHKPADGQGDLVFTTPGGERHEAAGRDGLALKLRAHLRAFGLDKERPELFTTTAERRRMRVHDLRGTFVTIALANGKSESWISDRTGHRSSQMIARYKRVARTFGELQSGDLVPLADALPEFRAGRERVLAPLMSNHEHSPIPSFPGNPAVSAGYDGARSPSNPIARSSDSLLRRLALLRQLGGVQPRQVLRSARLSGTPGVVQSEHADRDPGVGAFGARLLTERRGAGRLERTARTGARRLGRGRWSRASARASRVRSARPASS